MTPAKTVLLLLVVTLGCGRAGPPSADPVLVRVSVDGAEVAQVRGSELAGERRLAELVPPAARDMAEWTRWTATSGDGRTLRIADPAATYDDHEVVLRRAGARAEVAILRRARPDQPPHLRAALLVPEASLIGATAIAIETRGAPPAAGTAPPRRPGDPLVIVRDGQPRVMAADVLDALPLLPGDDHEPDGGWDLRTVLAAGGVSGAPDDVIRAFGREGQVALRAGELARPGVRASLRRNRRGQLRLTVARDATSREVLHAVARLEVGATPP